MIQHYFKLIWNRKRKNGFLLAELIISFLIFQGVFSFAIDKYKQFNIPRGFDTENVYSIYLGQKTDLQTVDSLLQKTFGEVLTEHLKSIPEIVGVSRSGATLPYSGGRNSRGYSAGEDSDQRIEIQSIAGDENFADVWGLEFVSGRFFERSDSIGFVKKIPVVINEKLDKILEKQAYVSEKFSKSYHVIGVVKNFKYDGDFKTEPFLMFEQLRIDKNPLAYKVYSVKARSGTGPEILPKLYKAVENITKNNEFKLKIVKNEQRKANRSTVIPLLTLLFIGLFLVISISMGLLGVLKYNINSRISEVGLRKVVGATTTDIKKMFVGEMTTLALVAFVIAMLFAIQVPFVSSFPIARSSYFAGMGIGALLIFGLVFFCSLAPSRQLARVLPAEALREE